MALANQNAGYAQVGYATCPSPYNTRDPPYDMSYGWNTENPINEEREQQNATDDNGAGLMVNTSSGAGLSGPGALTPSITEHYALRDPQTGPLVGRELAISRRMTPCRRGWRQIRVGGRGPVPGPGCWSPDQLQDPKN
ncbi:hypothetical protein CR513_12451, partial [Mucuna pruriens]